MPAGAAIDVVQTDDDIKPALTRAFHLIAVVPDLPAATDLVAAQPQVTAVTADGDLLSSWFAAGGSSAGTGHEVQATIDEAAAELDLARHDAERIRSRWPASKPGYRTPKRCPPPALERLNDSDAQMSALIEQLANLGHDWPGGARRGRPRLQQTIDQASHTRTQDEQNLEELRARLAAADQDTDLTEPIPPNATGWRSSLGRPAGPRWTRDWRSVPPRNVPERWPVGPTR